MIKSIKLKPIMLSEGEVLSYVIDDLELDSDLIQSYYDYDRKTISALSTVYRLLMESLYNSLGYEDRDQVFNEGMREGILNHTNQAIESWKSNMKSRLEKEQLQKADHLEVLSRAEIQYLVNTNAHKLYSDYTSFLKSEHPIEEDSTEEDDQE